MDAPPSESNAAFLALWEHVSEHWNDEAAHAALLSTCDEEGSLALAAREYRREAASKEELHAQVAEDQLKKITVLAFARIEAARSDPPQNKRVILIIALIVSCLLIGISTLLLSH